MAFAPARVHAYAECRSTHHHVWGGVPKDLLLHVLQHPKGLLAHLPNTLLHHGLCTGSLDSTVTGRGSALSGSSSTVSGDSRGSEGASSSGIRSVRFSRMRSLRSSSRRRKAIWSSRLRI